MKEYSPDVLIYVQKSKKFFESNDDAREYFFIKDEESFNYYCEMLSDIAQRNYDDSNDPAISRIQFEEIRIKMMKFAVDTNHIKIENILPSQFPKHLLN